MHRDGISCKVTYRDGTIEANVALDRVVVVVVVSNISSSTATSSSATCQAENTTTTTTTTYNNDNNTNNNYDNTNNTNTNNNGLPGNEVTAHVANAVEPILLPHTNNSGTAKMVNGDHNNNNNNNNNNNTVMATQEEKNKNKKENDDGILTLVAGATRDEANGIAASSASRSIGAANFMPIQPSVSSISEASSISPSGSGTPTVSTVGINNMRDVNLAAATTTSAAASAVASPSPPVPLSSNVARDGEGTIEGSGRSVEGAYRDDDDDAVPAAAVSRFTPSPPSVFDTNTRASIINVGNSIATASIGTVGTTGVTSTSTSPITPLPAVLGVTTTTAIATVASSGQISAEKQQQQRWRQIDVAMAEAEAEFSGLLRSSSSGRAAGRSSMSPLRGDHQDVSGGNDAAGGTSGRAIEDLYASFSSSTGTGGISSRASSRSPSKDPSMCVYKFVLYQSPPLGFKLGPLSVSATGNPHIAATAATTASSLLQRDDEQGRTAHQQHQQQLPLPVIVELDAEGPSAMQGLAVGDVLENIEDQEVSSFQEAEQLLQSCVFPLAMQFRRSATAAAAAGTTPR